MTGHFDGCLGNGTCRAGQLPLGAGRLMAKVSVARRIADVL